MSLPSPVPSTHLDAPRQASDCRGFNDNLGNAASVCSPATVLGTERCPEGDLPLSEPPRPGTVPILFLNNGGFMHACITLASSALALVLVLALVREVRLRRALQVLLRRLLDKWRKDTPA